MADVIVTRCSQKKNRFEYHVNINFYVHSVAGWLPPKKLERASRKKLVLLLKLYPKPEAADLGVKKYFQMS